MPIDRDDDLYEVLQVSPRAEHEIVEAAYRRLALRYHPDRNPGSIDAGAHMARINQAYEILGAPAGRATYDRERAGRSGSTTASTTAWRPRPATRPLRQAPRKPLLDDFSLTPWRYRRARLLTKTVPPRIATVAGGSAIVLAPYLVLGGSRFEDGPGLEAGLFLWLAASTLMAALILASSVYFSLHYVMKSLLSLEAASCSLYDLAMARYESELVSWRVSAEFME